MNYGTMDSGDKDGSHGESYEYSIISKKLTEFVHPFVNSPTRLTKNYLF